MNGNEWYNEWQQITTSNNDWSFRLIFLFFRIRQEPTTKHPKENALNIEENLEKQRLSTNKPLRRNINSKKQELSLWYIQL